MKVDICTRCQVRITGCRIKLRVRDPWPRLGSGHRPLRPIPARHELCDLCAGQLGAFLGGRRLADFIPPPPPAAFTSPLDYDG